MKLERKIEIMPAYNRRDPDPKKNYGIHGVTMAFYLIGELGVIQFILYTNWQLPQVELETFGSWGSPKYENHSRTFCKPMAADIGYHSPTPLYEGQTVMREECPLMPGKPCYYDGSSLYAEEIFKVLVEKGGDGLWAKLEEEYNERFILKK